MCVHTRTWAAVHTAMQLSRCRTAVYTAVCIWAGGRSQEEVLAELIMVLEFPACESSAAVLVVLTDTGRKS